MSDKHSRTLSMLAASYGYAVERGGKHFRLRPIPPLAGRPITVSVSPKNPDHWLKQVTRDLRNATNADR